MVGSIAEILHRNEKLRSACVAVLFYRGKMTTVFCDVRRKRKIAARMVRSLFAVHIYATCLVNRSKVQDQTFTCTDPVGFYGKLSTVPEIFVRLKLPADTGESAFR